MVQIEYLPNTSTWFCKQCIFFTNYVYEKKLLYCAANNEQEIYAYWSTKCARTTLQLDSTITVVNVVKEW